MRRDFLFLLSNIPQDRLLQGEHFFMANMDENAMKELQQIGVRVPQLPDFLRKCGNVRPVCLGIRNDFPDRDRAIDAALHTEAVLIDGYSLFVETTVPEAALFLQIREGSSPDADLFICGESGGWALVHPKSDEARNQWQQRNANLTHTVLHFFDKVLDVSELTNSDLAQQLLYSAKMFRYGRTSGVFGIDYLCRFTALEGLVCGNEVRRKEQLLKERLTALFRGSRDVNTEIAHLWALRCEASHQGKAFDLHNVPGSPQLARQIGLVECYFIAALVFTLENSSLSTVDALWQSVTQYQLPAWAALERPRDMPRYAINRFLMPLGRLPGVGPRIDDLYANRTFPVPPQAP